MDKKVTSAAEAVAAIEERCTMAQQKVNTSDVVLRG